MTTYRDQLLRRFAVELDSDRWHSCRGLHGASELLGFFHEPELEIHAGSLVERKVRGVLVLLKALDRRFLLHSRWIVRRAARMVAVTIRASQGSSSKLLPQPAHTLACERTDAQRSMPWPPGALRTFCMQSQQKWN